MAVISTLWAVLMNLVFLVTSAYATINLPSTHRTLQ